MQYAQRIKEYQQAHNIAYEQSLKEESQKKVPEPTQADKIVTQPKREKKDKDNNINIEKIPDKNEETEKEETKENDEKTLTKKQKQNRKKKLQKKKKKLKLKEEQEKLLLENKEQVEKVETEAEPKAKKSKKSKKKEKKEASSNLETKDLSTNITEIKSGEESKANANEDQQKIMNSNTKSEKENGQKEENKPEVHHQPSIFEKSSSI